MAAAPSASASAVPKRPLLIGASARIYYPGTPGVNIGGVFTKTLHYLEQSVAHLLLREGALVVMVPGVSSHGEVLREDLNLKHYAQALDGLLLQGGNDVAPQNYGESPLDPAWAGDAVRDRYEIELIHAFVEAGKPVFGICRGMQLLNVAFGGTLLQDIATQRPHSRSHRDGSRYERHFHGLALQPGTRLHRLYATQEEQAAQRPVNSIHHQGIKDLAPGFIVEARCPEDGIVEAIRREGQGFVAAVQWHPEFHEAGSSESFDDGPLIRDFLTACRQAQLSD